MKTYTLKEVLALYEDNNESVSDYTANDEMESLVNIGGKVSC